MTTVKRIARKRLKRSILVYFSRVLKRSHYYPTPPATIRAATQNDAKGLGSVEGKKPLFAFDFFFDDGADGSQIEVAVVPLAIDIDGGGGFHADLIAIRLVPRQSL